ncbi:MAG: hypothetical protein SGJ10_14085 [Bacteroidota bacterium]|nr:hypothetical protein [Bacteroidota bacterium]
MQLLKLKSNYLIWILLLLSSNVYSQDSNKVIRTTPIPIAIKWVDSIAGNFSFRNEWSYPLGVELKKDGKAGCADGGFCPQDCYDMMDKEGMVKKKYSSKSYQLLDTSHLPYSMQCEAWCYEWAGTNYVEVHRKSADSIYCFTTCGIATHCSLELYIVNDTCYASIDLNSIRSGCCTNFYSTDGYITIDRKLWDEGIMKAEFSFNFDYKNPRKDWPMYWKGKVYSKIEGSL